ncbi:hypothetical protein [Halomonas organivorans]|uniref:Uncharacterized protein n=1 Tax=Halomonas organivorans TaxID=257772 RepID=A0A7W5BZV7_9GAMM|nr:hypothetical protein [Halomonas organivorans]MBB3142226.1 hypothetical protein [Halomonas organivorans]
MRLIDQLTAHPLLDERPIKHVLEPMGFEVHVESVESPCPDDMPEEHQRFTEDPDAYLEGLDFDVPDGFTELGRWETEEAEIVLLAVKPATALALALMTPVDDAEVLE